MQAVKDIQNESKQLHEQVKKLEQILEAYQSKAYQSESLAGSNLKDRLDGLHRYVVLHLYH